MKNGEKSNNVSGLRVKQLLKEYGVTQEQLAEALDITPNALSMIVCGKRGLTQKRAQQIASLFPNARVDWLLGLDNCRTGRQKEWNSLFNSIKRPMKSVAAVSDLFRAFGVSIESTKKVDIPPELIEHVIETRNPGGFAAELLEVDVELNLIDSENAVTITHNGKVIRCSRKDYQSLVDEIADFAEFKLNRFLEDMDG